jgi:hypothetical protein
MTIFGLRPAICACFLTTVALFICGCDKTSAPAPADEGAAKETLTKALDAWQRGEKPEALKSASPSIVVSDNRWESGNRLTKYELDGDGKPSGAQQAFKVKLWLTDAKGKEVKDIAEYQVGTKPILTVIRPVFQ